MTATDPGVRPHRAVLFENDLGNGQWRRECLRCPRPVIGFGPSFRHYGEPEPAVQPDPKYAESLERAQAVITSTANVDAATARQAAIALYVDGLLRQRRATP